MPKSLPEMARAETNPGSTTALETHLQEMQGQIERIDQILEACGTELERIGASRWKACSKEGRNRLKKSEGTGARHRANSLRPKRQRTTRLQRTGHSELSRDSWGKRLRQLFSVRHEGRKRQRTISYLCSRRGGVAAEAPGNSQPDVRRELLRIDGSSDRRSEVRDCRFGSLILKHSTQSATLLLSCGRCVPTRSLG